MSSIRFPADRSVAAGPIVASRPREVAATKPHFITWVTLAFMTTASVASLRSAPTMAVYGLACVFLYVIPAIVFLLPQSLVAAELASGWSGGVFRWVSEGMSPGWGMLAVWCQFAMTIFYYPALLGFVASTLAYVIDPALASNGLYTGVVIVVVFWAAVLVSARGGVGAIAKLASNGLVIGTLIPGALLLALGVVFLGQGNPSAAPMDGGHLLPEWTGIASLVLIVNNFLSYSGMEMNAVHVSSLRRPGSEFPKAMFMSVGLVLLIFILPALAISWVVPAQQLSLTAGVMQAFSSFFSHFGIERLVPLVALALVCASLGGMLTWLAGPSKGLVMIARQEGYLPPFLQKVNALDVPVNLLVVQGVVTTVIGLLYALVPSVSSAYWILSVMTTQVYLIMYVLMFTAARRLRRDQPDVERGFRAPWLTLLCVVGGTASVAAFAIGFVPPSQFGSGNAGAYALVILAGTGLIGLLPAWLFLRLRKPGWRVAAGSPSALPLRSDRAGATAGAPTDGTAGDPPTAAEDPPTTAGDPPTTAEDPPTTGEPRGTAGDPSAPAAGPPSSAPGGPRTAPGGPPTPGDPPRATTAGDNPRSRPPAATRTPSAGGAAPSPPASGSPGEEPADRGVRRLYWAIGAVVVALLVVGLVRYSAAKNDAEAQRKAQQLVQRFDRLGLAAPVSRNDIARSLGTDGGAVCANPANALGKATLDDMLANGASFVGHRPVIFDRRILLGEVMILQVYCPEKLAPYRQKIDALKLRNTVSG